jgi:hypothetical protein
MRMKAGLVYLIGPNHAWTRSENTVIRTPAPQDRAKVATKKVRRVGELVDRGLWTWGLGGAMPEASVRPCRPPRERRPDPGEEKSPDVGR